MRRSRQPTCCWSSSTVQGSNGSSSTVGVPSNITSWKLRRRLVLRGGKRLRQEGISEGEVRCWQVNEILLIAFRRSWEGGECPTPELLLPCASVRVVCAGTHGTVSECWSRTQFPTRHPIVECVRCRACVFVDSGSFDR